MKLAAIAAALFVVASCSGTTSPREVLPTAPPEFTSGQECPGAPAALDLPPSAGCVTTARSADGGADLVVYALMDEDRFPRTWRMRVAGGRQAPIDQSLRAGTATSYPRAVGGADVDGDGDEEWFVKVLNLAGHGAAWGMLNLFVLTDRFEALTLDGDPMPLYLGGISRTGEGVTCRRDALVLLRAEAQNVRNTTWNVSARYYRIQGTRAVLLHRKEGVLELSDYNDRALDPYYLLECKGLRYSV